MEYTCCVNITVLELKIRRIIALMALRRNRNSLPAWFACLCQFACFFFVYACNSIQTLAGDPDGGHDGSFDIATDAMTDDEAPGEQVPDTSPVTWARTYDLSDDDLAWDIIPVSEGGYIVSGITEDLSSRSGILWVLRLNEYGNILWQKSYGRTSIYPYGTMPVYVREFSDGGFLIAAGISFFEDHRFPSLLKIDRNGDVEWYHESIYSSVELQLISIDMVPMGGFVFAGWNWWDGYDLIIWILRVDDNVNIVWQKSFRYGEPSYILPWSVKATGDGGFIIAAMNEDLDDSPEDYGALFLIKLDAGGDVVWQKKYVDPVHADCYGVLPTSDGGYILSGSRQAEEGDEEDAWILKLNGRGDIVWQKTYGGAGDDGLNSMVQIPGGGFVGAGHTRLGPDIQGNIWVVSLGEEGNVLWQRAYGAEENEQAYRIRQATDGGFIIAGIRGYITQGPSDIWIIKTDEQGNISDNCPPGMIADTSATISETSAVAAPLELTEEDLSLVLGPATIVSSDTSAVVETQCSRP